MPRILRCKDLPEAVEYLTEEGNDCASVAAYLHAAGVTKARAIELLTAAGFADDRTRPATAALYATLETRIVERIRTLRTMREANEDDNGKSCTDE